EELAAFWCRLLDWHERRRDGADWISIGGGDPTVWINVQAEAGYVPPVWPERPGDQQKQVHFELGVDDVPAAVRFAIECGATEAPHQPPDRDPATLRVMLDPAGHPFCLGV
ncbi:MAG TPA: VOC family protein, partial [Acidimicrobiales bacterium]|nr:VOC family protein [Acidimicrobiales bacterium]